MRAQLGGLGAACRFLTSLPLPGTLGTDLGDLRRALPFFPAVGLGLGLLLVLVDGLLGAWLARPLVDLGLLAVLVCASGGLHLDGLIDSVDGLFGPGPAERRLAAMRESWASKRGAAAALAQLLLQYAALASLAGPARPAALLLAPLLGRWAVVLGYVSFPYARPPGSGLSSALKAGATPAAGLVAGGFTLLAAGLVSWPGGALWFGLACLITTLIGLLARRRLGGMSGDVYGAAEQLVETATLLLVPLAPGVTWRWP